MKTLVLNFLVVVTIVGAVCGIATAQKPDRAMGPNLGQTELSSSTNASFFRVFAGEARSHWVYLTAGTYADVELEGDGSTDLDLYIYDSNLNPIASRTGRSDMESVGLKINRSGNFLVKVVNRGSVYNDYSLFVTSY